MVSNPLLQVAQQIHPANPMAMMASGAGTEGIGMGKANQSIAQMSVRWPWKEGREEAGAG